MRDFTLVIPTYNRPRELRALLYFLRSTHPELKFIVLDSSEDKAPVREIVSENHLIDYPPDTHPFDKFLDGARRVETEYCQICADDDVVLLDGVSQCLEALRAKPNAVCVKGGTWSFTWNPDEPATMHLADGYQLRPSFEQETGAQRLIALFEYYSATVYAVHRTDRLRSCLAAAANMKTLMGKELLCSAMAVVTGPVLSVDVLTHGRSMGKSVLPYRNWHPLEFFCNNAVGLGQEYGVYRSRLGFALLGELRMTPDFAMRLVDLIHLRYLVQHCPREVLDYLLQCQLDNIQAEISLSPEMQKALLNASLGPHTRGLGSENMQRLFDTMGPYMWGLTPHDGAQMAREARGLVSEAWGQSDSLGR